MGISLGILFGLTAMLGWGLADFFAKKAVDEIGDFKTLLWAQTVGLVFLSFFYFMFGANFSYTITNILIFAITGVLGTSAYLLFYRALRKGQLSVISPIQASWVVITVILSVFFLKESLSSVQIYAIIITIIGIILVSFKYKDLVKLNLKNFLPGVPEDMVSMTFWGVNFVIIGFLISQFNWFVPILFLRFFTVLLLFGSTGAKKEHITFHTKKVVPWLMLIGLFDVMAFVGFGLGVNSEYVSIVSPVAASFPLITVIMARVFLKEKLDLNQIIGFVGILIGLLILSV